MFTERARDSRREETPPPPPTTTTGFFCVHRPREADAEEGAFRFARGVSVVIRKRRSDITLPTRDASRDASQNPTSIVLAAHAVLGTTAPTSNRNRRRDSPSSTVPSASPHASHRNGIPPRLPSAGSRRGPSDSPSPIATFVTLDATYRPSSRRDAGDASTETSTKQHAQLSTHRSSSSRSGGRQAAEARSARR